MIDILDKDDEDNLNTSDGNSIELRLRRNPFIILFSVSATINFKGSATINFKR